MHPSLIRPYFQSNSWRNYYQESAWRSPPPLQFVLLPWDMCILLYIIILLFILLPGLISSLYGPKHLLVSFVTRENLCINTWNRKKHCTFKNQPLIMCVFPTCRPLWIDWHTHYFNCMLWLGLDWLHWPPPPGQVHGFWIWFHREYLQICSTWYLLTHLFNNYFPRSHEYFITIVLHNLHNFHNSIIISCCLILVHPWLYCRIIFPCYAAFCCCCIFSTQM